MPEQISRRLFLKRTILGFGATSLLGSAGLVYAISEPLLLSTERVEIRLPNLPAAFDGFTIAQITDMHFGEWMTLQVMRQVVRHTNSLSPDVIALTGDYVGRSKPDAYTALIESFGLFQAREAIVAVLGNHDHWTGANAVRQAIQVAGNVTLLDNAPLAVHRGGQALYFVGLDDIWENQHDLDHAMASVPTNAATVLLAHEPDYADVAAAHGGIGLQLSGHSHGGQVRIPGVGAVHLPRMGVKYDMGLYRIGDMHVYVNRGVGMTYPYVRFRCPPEVTLITLRA